MIDPELAPIVDLANSVPPTDMATVAPADLRATVRAAALASPPGPEVAAVADRTIPGPGGDVPVRIYTPAGGSPVGLLVFFHGSGFVIYDLDTHDPECRWLANLANVVVVSVDYRLAPEHPFPAALDDCLAATHWAADHADELGANGGGLAVGGDSAGGNLAAVVAQVVRDANGPAIAAQMLVYPVTDLAAESPSYAENASGYLLTAETMRFFINAYTPEADDRLDPTASPLRSVDLAGLPPALVITAEYDPLRDEGEAYARALQAANVTTTLTRYDGAVHGFFQMSAISSLARRAIDECAAFVRAAVAEPA